MCSSRLSTAEYNIGVDDIVIERLYQIDTSRDDDISSLRQYLWYVETKNITHIGRETIAGDVSSIQVGLFYMYE